MLVQQVDTPAYFQKVSFLIYDACQSSKALGYLALDWVSIDSAPCYSNAIDGRALKRLSISLYEIDTRYSKRGAFCDEGLPQILLKSLAYFSSFSEISFCIFLAASSGVISFAIALDI
jgi:hypothetical protein